jgi:hypothetical protein
MDEILNFTAQDMPDNTMVFSAEDVEARAAIVDIRDALIALGLMDASS